MRIGVEDLGPGVADDSSAISAFAGESPGGGDPQMASVAEAAESRSEATRAGIVAERQQEMEAQIRDGETNQELRPWRYDDAPTDRLMPSARARRIGASGGLAERGCLRN